MKPPVAPPSWLLWAILGLGLALRIGFLLAVDTQPVTDFAWYADKAEGIAQGLGYSNEGRPTAYWPVGYPAFLSLAALLGNVVFWGKILNLLLSLVCAVLTIWLGKELTNSGWAGLAAGLIIAVHPSFVMYSGVLASEPLFTSLLLLSCLWLVRSELEIGPWLAGSGLALGVAMLVRPQGVFIAGAVFLALALENRSRAFVAAIVVLGAALVPVLPWVATISLKMGGVVAISTNGGDNLLIGHHPGANGKYKNPDQCGLVRAPGLSELERDRLARKQGFSNFVSKPLESIGLIPAKLSAGFFGSTDASYWAFQTERGKLIVPGAKADKPLYLFAKSASWWAQGLLLVLAIMGLALSWIRKDKKARAPTFAILACALTLAVFFGNPRFVFPILPFLAILAAWLLTAFES